VEVAESFSMYVLLLAPFARTHLLPPAAEHFRPDEKISVKYQITRSITHSRIVKFLEQRRLAMKGNRKPIVEDDTIATVFLSC
jgi:hypothetical protein